MQFFPAGRLNAPAGENSIAAMTRWTPCIVAAKPAANEPLPGMRSRGEVGIQEVGRYRKVVLASPGKPTRRRGTFFSSTA